MFSMADHGTVVASDHDGDPGIPGVSVKKKYKH